MSSISNGGYNYYSSMFASPVNSYDNSPITNLIYGSISSQVYQKTIAKNLNSAASSYFSSMKSLSVSLKDAVSAFSNGDSESTFNKRSISSSDSSSVSGTADAGTAVQTFKVNVSKIAAAQINKSFELRSNAITDMSVGSKKFSIKIGNTEKDISFTTSLTDTNKNVLEKMAQSINTAKLGVTAKVINNTEKNTSYLSISSDKTGKDSAFTITDKDNGNAVSSIGISKVSTAAENLEVTIDGKAYTSQTNTISLNNDKIKLNFSKATNKDVLVSVSSDTNSLKTDIKNVVKQYNELIKFSNANSNIASDRLTQKLGSAIKSQMSSLEHIGIKKNSDGTLSVNDTTLQKAIDSNSSELKSSFNDGYGLVKNLSDLATDMSKHPSRFADMTKMFSPDLKGLFLDVSL